MKPVGVARAIADNIDKEIRDLEEQAAQQVNELCETYLRLANVRMVEALQARFAAVVREPAVAAGSPVEEDLQF